MNCDKILFDLSLCYGGNFSNINDFCDIVVKKYSLKGYSDVVSLLNSKAKVNPEIITKDNALDLIISEDINNFSIESYQCLEQRDFMDLINEHIADVVSFYQSIGLDISTKDIDFYFCDTFPKPFDRNKGIALAPDRYDESKFGIKSGIYFLNSNLSYYQSRLLVAHEILHIVCSKHHPELLARGLEEGLCELIGSFFANSILFERPIPENYIKFRRFKYANPNQKFRLYSDYMRMAYWLLKQINLNGIIDIINGGRGKIKAIETELIHNCVKCKDTKKSHPFDVQLTADLDKLMLGNIENEVVSPLAYYIIKQYDGERDITTFARTHNIKLEDCIEAFIEIQNRIYGCVIDNNVVELSDLIQLRHNGNVSYECIKR